MRLGRIGPDTIKCIEKYIRIADDDSLINHWKELSERLIAGIKENYSNREEEIVKSIINKVNKFETQNKQLRISTKSVFIHGNKSQVEFDYYGKSTKRELGDIIFILSVVYNNKKYFEKMTINQVKKSKGVSWQLNSKSAKEQVYLLSRFPTFKGTKRSLIPEKKEYNLQNLSGCLGTHGLLYSPGDFALISSRGLEILLSNKKTIQLSDLLKLETNFCYLLCDIEEFIRFLYWILPFFPKYFVCRRLPLLGNDCIAYNVYDFSQKYILGLIGDMIYAKDLPYNTAAFRFLHDLFGAIRRKAQKKQLQDVSNFIRSFYSYEYAGGDIGGEGFREGDYEEAGGIGIIYTVVNLGESE